MNQETARKINYQKYQITQNLIETNYSSIDESLFYSFVEDVSRAFLDVETYFKNDYTPNELRTVNYLSVLSNYCEVCKEVEKYIDTASHIYTLIGALLPIINNDTHESVKFLLELQKDSMMKLNLLFFLQILDDLTTYDENVYMIYMCMLSHFEDMPSHREPLLDCLSRLTSQQTHSDVLLSLSILQYQENRAFDGNKHASILYKTCKDHKKDTDPSLFSLLTEVFEKELDISETIELERESLLKYVWSLLYICQVEENHSRTDLLFNIFSILVDRYTLAIHNSCLIKLILEKIYASLKEDEEMCDMRKTSVEHIFTILKDDMNMYNYLATIVSPDDIPLFSYVNSDVLRSKITAFSKDDSEVDILTSQPILQPCSIKNGDQTITLDRSTVEHLILENGQNPFTREPLDFDSLKL